MPKRLRVLLSAYFCSPYKGSESGLGWNVATRLAKHHDVTVLCGDLQAEQPTLADLNRYRLEQALPEGLRIEHVSPDLRTRLLNRVHQLPGLWFAYYVAYKRWQQLAFERAKKLHSNHPFDVVHHLNIIGYREPGYLWKLGIPFFWGPLSGAPIIPASFLRDFSLLQRLRWGTRNMFNYQQLRGSARCRAAAAAASRIWAVSSEDLAMIQNWGFAANPLLETGASPAAPEAKPVERRGDEPLRLVWSGLFLGIKALPLVLRAIARLPESTAVTLDVLGEGPESELWKQEARELNLGSKVKFHGYLPKDEALAVMRGAHVLVHSSVKEGTPHVVLEALSMGLPVICHDACGMGTAVTDDCGIRIPLTSPETSIRGFADAFATLLAAPRLMTRLSEGALARARQLSWDLLIETIDNSYAENAALQNH